MKMEDGVIAVDVQDAAIDAAPCLNGNIKAEEETVIRVSPNSELQNHSDSRDDSDARTSDGEDITPMSPPVESEKEDTPLISFDVNCVDVNANVDCPEAEQMPLDENVDNHLVLDEPIVDAVEMVPCGQGHCGQGHCEMGMSSLCENICDVSSAHSDGEDVVLFQLDAVPEDCACSPNPPSPREMLTGKETSCCTCDNALLIALQEKIQQQNCIIERLQLENLQNCVPSVDDQANGETGPDVYELQMTALENAITQLQKETDLYRGKLADQEKIYKSRVQQMEHDSNLKFEKVLKQLESALKDKDAMIMKFAQSEKEVLDLAKVRDQLDRKLKSSTRERDALLTKLKSISSEKTRMHSSLEAKMSELRAAQKENERMKEDVSSREIKIKWAQNKYKSEFDAHNETRQKVEKLTHKLSEAEEEINKIRSDCQNVILDYQQSEEFKTIHLDTMSETEPKAERQEKYDTEEAFNMIKQELETLKKKHKLSLDENNILAMKVQCLEKERLEYEQNLSKLKENVGILKQECVDLQGKLGEMGNVQNQIEREREKVAVSKAEVERLRQVNIDLQADMDCCHRKEGELLEFAEKLTSKNVLLQSEFGALEANYQSLQLENNSIKKSCEELEMQNTGMVSRLEEETQLRSQETQLLARKLAEKAKYAESINSKLEEEKNENAVLRRKMTSSVKELTRELQQTRKKLDLCDVRNGGSDAKSLGSRTSSNCSLDTIMPSTSVALPSLSNTKQDTTEELQHMEPDRHTLIDRIVKLQKSHARKNEKIEFLEEHVNQLQTEVKKKNRLIQNYIMREEAGALSTESMERNKIELSKRGGVMASLYGSRFTDGTMTLDLSMEINQKLQAVLEDILLKNITLKENINTLGEEIARLAQDNSTLRYEVRLKT